MSGKEKIGYLLANTLTLSRAGFALASVLATGIGHPELGIKIWLAGLPTELDGAVARDFNAVSPEGALRDRLADHSFFTTAFLVNSALFLINHSSNTNSANEIGFRIWIASSIILINTVFTYWDVKNYRKNLSRVNSPSL